MELGWYVGNENISFRWYLGRPKALGRECRSIFEDPVSILSGVRAAIDDQPSAIFQLDRSGTVLKVRHTILAEFLPLCRRQSWIMIPCYEDLVGVRS